MTKVTIQEAATRLGVSHWRVRQVYKQLGIAPVGYDRNSPLFSLAQVKQMKQRNTKPGPRGNGKEK